MATNNFLPFCPTDSGTNLLTNAEYLAATDRTVGNQPGVASSKLNNKAFRQANVMASQLAQYVSDKTGLDMLDNGNLTNILNALIAAFAPTTQEYDITNLSLSASVAANALTIAVKDKSGADASATSPITVGVRSVTLTSGAYTTRSITGALSMVLSSGSTLGQTSGQPSIIYVYLIDNAGTLELAVSHTFYPENNLVTTVAEGGAGGADSASTIYSTSARSNVPMRLIGYILNTQATAGIWGSAATQIQLLPTSTFTTPTIQTFTSGSGTYNTPAGVKYVRVRLVGGGGGGQGSASPGTDGGITTFGTTLLVGNGGVAGSGSNGGGGGTASLGTGPIGLAIQGGTGNGGMGNVGGNFPIAGGMGAASPFGGNGAGTIGTGGTAAVANSGSGGGGYSSAGVSSSMGGGGGSGGFVDAIIPAASLLSSYSYAIGAAGTGGTGVVGGNGGSGIIIVEEHYQ